MKRLPSRDGLGGGLWEFFMPLLLLYSVVLWIDTAQPERSGRLLWSKSPLFENA
jgi:hypothetical protein